MIYSVAITIAAALLIFALIGAVALLARKLSGHDVRLPAFGRWNWHPSPLGLLLLVPALALLVFRRVPGLFLLPFIIPVVVRGRRVAGHRAFFWDYGGHPAAGQRPEDDNAIPGEYRPIDDE